MTQNLPPMKMKLNPKKEALLWAIILAPLALMLALRDVLPAEVPTHWNWKGEADGFDPPWLFALFNAGLYLTFLVVLFIDPKRRNLAKYGKAVYGMRLTLHLFLSALHAVVLLNAAGWEMTMEKVVFCGVLFLIAALGNFMVALKRNYFFGIRTPWTLESDYVWEKTHRLGGRMWFWGGLAGGILGLALPVFMVKYALFVILAPLVLVPTIYSYVLYRKTYRNGDRPSRREPEPQPETN